MERPRSAHEVLAGIRTFNAASGELLPELVLRWPGNRPAARTFGIGMVPREAGTMASEISARNSAHAVLVLRRT